MACTKDYKKEYHQIGAYRNGWLLAIADWITILPWLGRLAKKTASSVTLDYQGDKQLIESDIQEGAFFMTNHRDICMDSAWLTWLLKRKYNIRPYIGIGNNLFGKWWIEFFVRFNHCFVVIRNGGLHEQIRNATTLSHYIHYLRNHKKSIWLAQREGRAKDSNDLTQPALIKMLTIGEPDFFRAIQSLNICPVSISYEFDPCDFLKAQEMQLKRDNPNWKKSKEDDIRSMATGISGKKGKVVFRMTPSINHELELILTKEPEWKERSRNEQIGLVCKIIDQHIHSAYEITHRGTDFAEYIQQRVSLIDIPNKDEAYLREKLIEMYTYPEKNHKKYEESHIPR